MILHRCTEALALCSADTHYRSAAVNNNAAPCDNARQCLPDGDDQCWRPPMVVCTKGIEEGRRILREKGDEMIRAWEGNM